MDIKVPLNSQTFTTDVAALPSAPPPSYEDAIGASSSRNYGGSFFAPPTTPLIAENYVQGASPQPINTGISPYPVQQVQITSAVLPVTATLPVGREPLKTNCPACSKAIRTRIRHKMNCLSTLCCVLLFATCICIPCSCIIPYMCCGKPCKVIKYEHTCPKCNAFLGTYVEN